VVVVEVVVGTTLGDEMGGAKETLPGDETTGIIGDGGHLGIGGRFVGGGPIDADDVGGGVGVAFCSNIRINPSLLWLSGSLGISGLFSMGRPGSLDVGCAEVLR
jgi:hypothetical protein